MTERSSNLRNRKPPGVIQLAVIGGPPSIRSRKSQDVIRLAAMGAHRTSFAWQRWVLTGRHSLGSDGYDGCSANLRNGRSLGVVHLAAICAPQI